MEEYHEGELIVYQNGDRFEIGKIKRLTETGAFIWYSTGDTAAKTPFEAMHKLTNAYAITDTTLGKLDAKQEPQGLDAEMEYGGKKVRLHRCPFCGSTPLIHSYRNRMKNWFRIRCSNKTETCCIMPETMAHLKLEDAAADWNMRPKEDAP